MDTSLSARQSSKCATREGVRCRGGREGGGHDAVTVSQRCGCFLQLPIENVFILNVAEKHLAKLEVDSCRAAKHADVTSMAAAGRQNSTAEPLGAINFRWACFITTYHFQWAN